MKDFGFTKIHHPQQVLYNALERQNPIIVDDEEVLVKLSAYTSTLTPLITA